MKIGVLAIQGDYEAHKARLEQLGADVTLVRKPEHLDAIDAIVIPGGESSTFLNFLAERGFLVELATHLPPASFSFSAASASSVARVPVGSSVAFAGVDVETLPDGASVEAAASAAREVWTCLVWASQR